MTMDQTLGILVQIGAVSITTGLLYVVQQAMVDPDRDAKERLARIRNARREAVRETALRLRSVDLNACAPSYIGSQGNPLPASHPFGSGSGSANQDYFVAEAEGLWLQAEWQRDAAVTSKVETP
jgi:hypothetical protein